VGASSSTYLLSAILINTGFFCFLIAWRGAFANLWAALIGKRPKPARKPKQGGANGSAIAKGAEPTSDFDADVAFTRYMDRREAMEDEGHEVPQSLQPSPVAPVRAQGGFGRKVV